MVGFIHKALKIAYNTTFKANLKTVKLNFH